MLSLDLPEDLMKKLKKFEQDARDVFSDVVEQGARDGCEQYVRPSLKSVIGTEPKPSPDGKTRENKSTGELVRALGVSPVLVDRNGIINARIGFNEPREHQPKTFHGTYYTQTNAMVANVLEYGSSKQKARPWLRPAKKKVYQLFKKEAEQAIKEYME